MGEQQQASIEAERIIASLEAKRAKCIQRGTDIADERAVLGYGAHVDNDKASRAKLDKLNAEAAVHASELASLDAALRTAGEKLAAARRAEAVEQDRVVARQIKQVVADLKEHGEVLDDALADVVTAGANLKECFDRLAKLGVSSPRHEQLQVMGNLSILTALGQTPWRRYFQTLAPRERKSFAAVMAAWCENLSRDADQRLGETKEVEHAAA